MLFLRRDGVLEGRERVVHCQRWWVAVELGGEDRVRRWIGVTGTINESSAIAPYSGGGGDVDREATVGEHDRLADDGDRRWNWRLKQNRVATDYEVCFGDQCKHPTEKNGSPRLGH
ncbi:hypothetical protein NL676_008519 [Syzygium grande]|nr:hypothetical protein NL676_008519 [Syzygium grande]